MRIVQVQSVAQVLSQRLIGTLISELAELLVDNYNTLDPQEVQAAGFTPALLDELEEITRRLRLLLNGTSPAA